MNPKGGEPAPEGRAHRSWLEKRIKRAHAVVLADTGWRRRVELTFGDLHHHGHFMGATSSGKTVTLENVFKGYTLNRESPGSLSTRRTARRSGGSCARSPARTGTAWC